MAKLVDALVSGTSGRKTVQVRVLFRAPLLRSSVMDVGVFSRCIKDLIVDHDKVDVPGFGIFYAENMPASFSDLRTIINPPYRRMYFAKADVGRAEGSLLFNHISKELGVTAEQAEVELSWCLGRLRSELDGNRACILPGLGRMKATSQHDYFFVPDDDLDICPEAFGLKPVCLHCSVANEPQPAPKPELQPAPRPELQPQPVSWPAPKPDASVVNPVLPEIKQSDDGQIRDIREIYGDLQTDGKRKDREREVPVLSEASEETRPSRPVRPAIHLSENILKVLRILALVLLTVFAFGVLLYILPDAVTDLFLYSKEQYHILHGLEL